MTQLDDDTTMDQAKKFIVIVRDWWENSGMKINADKYGIMRILKSKGKWSKIENVFKYQK